MSEGGGGHGFHARWITPGQTDPSGGGATPANYSQAPLIPFVGTGTGPGFTMDSEDVPTTPALPAGGAGAVYTNLAANSVKINFVDNSASEVRYNLERSLVPDFSTLDAVTALPMVLSTSATGGPGGAGSGTVSGLQAGTKYYFRLRASNYDGQSPPLDLGSVTTLTLSSPANPLARVQNNGDVKLTWNDVLPLGTKVSVTRSVNGGAYTEIAQVNQVAGGGANSYTDTTAHSGANSYRLQVIGGPGGSTSPTVDVPFVVQPISPTAADHPVDYGQGFPVPPNAGPGQIYAGPGIDIQLNGNGAGVTNGVPGMFDNDGDGFASLRLTSTNNGEAVSAYTTDQVDVSKAWTSQFDFQATSVSADGFVFVLQNNSPTFVGGGGGSGGYNGIGSKAVGIGFDTYNAHSTTGAFLGDTGPTSNDETNNPYTVGIGPNHGLDTTVNNGPDIHSGHHLRAILTFASTPATPGVGNLSESIIDLDDASKTVFNYNYGTVDLATQLGGNTAWLGFSGATGGANEQVDINNWVFSYPGSIVTPPPAFDSTVIGDGTTQRSSIKQVSVKFNTPVTLAPGALKLLKYSPDASGTVAPGDTGTDISSALNAPTSPDGGTTWVWTFTGANAQANGSLIDGVYSYSVDHTKVSNSAGTMAVDFTGGKFHRLFGDINGNKTVNTADYGQFRLTFGKTSADPAYVANFDFDSNGTVNTADYGQFRNRFGKVFSYT